ncbi:hypothetical protein [Cohnella cholangitidis]|uniref:Lipoprotein n=1 Tax=Cohnella cholangitidis TaxID=2598458 RepID=A0A7G5BST7_9BACL|nr:hypothetical protein [Cohnella cholangitidis]QMV40021.1 hypothetical protein FPL14_01500 [Cohnella cholangitidis]
MIIYKISFIIFTLIVLIGCADKQKLDFNFIFSYGVSTLNQLDTFKNTYTKDLVLDGLVETSLTLTDDEKEQILRKMQDINLFEYPVVNEGLAMEPSSGYKFEIQYQGKRINVVWLDGFRDQDKDIRFSELVKLIQDIIESKEEYKKLPDFRSGYL